MPRVGLVRSGVGSARVLRRLTNLRTLEWCNVVWLAALLLWLLPQRRGVPIPAGTWQRSLAYLPVAALLVVGGWYWHRKYQQLRDGRPIDDALLMLDRFERASWWLLVVGTGIAAVSWASGTGTVTDRLWASGFVVFAWLEHVNYFRLQLMHDTREDLRRLLRTRRLRPSALASDLRRWRIRDRKVPR